MHASLDAGTKRKHIFGKRRHPCLADVEVQWGRAATPEAVCRIRDAEDSIQDHKLHKVKWNTINSLQEDDNNG